ncbi:hypothetical protein AB835_03330 [Candidatus Endobugula sertula]|uniref:Major facilitator superfamily (MFS) profile domain-containing protein n=1 Tax=Candidatus Endobugula sertula TaxID=62101 RepID=A0A1D2QSC1_9GAMM|nr:hypothetical protein AB835_03330 [Candidatus Endobugula sertula]
MALITLYLLGITSLSVALGIQIILLPWLVVDHLALGALWVGWVQLAVLIPNLLLLLVGGMIADQGKGVRYLVPLLIFNSILHVILAILIYQQWLGILLLITYAVLLGISNAFVQPWREYILNSIKYDQLQKRIAKSSLCLYGGQAIGVALTSLMGKVGAEILLFIQLFFVLLAVIFMWRLIALLTIQPSGYSNRRPVTRQALLRSGLRDIWSFSALRSLIVIVAFNGFFHIGVFIVILPLLVRQVYGGAVDFYSGLQLVFVIGTIVSTSVIIYRQPLHNPGSRIIFSLLYGGIILLALSAKPTVAGLFGLIFLWGIVVGISSNMGRTILQSLAPEALRGRMIAIYQLALFGSASLGALFAGYMIEIIGVLNVLTLSGFTSLLFFIATLLTRSLWNVTLPVDDVVESTSIDAD